MHVKKTEKRTKEVDVTIEDYRLCDKCNEKIQIETYELFECEFTHREGSNYPDGGHGNLQEMELCQKCVPAFVDLLRKNGYRVSESEWDTY